MADIINKKAFGKRLSGKRSGLISQEALGKIVYPELKSESAWQSKIKRFEAGKQLPKTREEVILLAKTVGVSWKYLIYGGKEESMGEIEKLKREVRELKIELNVYKNLFNGSADIKLPFVPEQDKGPG